MGLKKLKSSVKIDFQKHMDENPWSLFYIKVTIEFLKLIRYVECRMMGKKWCYKKIRVNKIFFYRNVWRFLNLYAIN